MKLTLIALGIIVCLLSLLLLVTMENEAKQPALSQLNTMQSYTYEEKQIDLFEKWQAEQPNKLAQKEWDAYHDED